MDGVRAQQRLKSLVGPSCRSLLLLAVAPVHGRVSRTRASPRQIHAVCPSCSLRCIGTALMMGLSVVLAALHRLRSDDGPAARCELAAHVPPPLLRAACSPRRCRHSNTRRHVPRPKSAACSFSEARASSASLRSTASRPIAHSTRAAVEESLTGQYGQPCRIPCAASRAANTRAHQRRSHVGRPGCTQPGFRAVAGLPPAVHDGCLLRRPGSPLWLPRRVGRRSPWCNAGGFDSPRRG